MPHLQLPRTLRSLRECLNCGAETGGAYCSHCGQATDVGRLNAAHWLGALLQNLSMVDGSLPRTLRGLTLNPGGTVREYVDGRRVSYVHPLRYAIGSAALWILAFVVFTDVELAASEPAARLMASWGQILNLALVPLLAGGIHITFLGTRTNYAEHLCLGLMLFGHAFLWRAGFVAFGNLFELDGVLVNSVDSVLLITYLSWGLWRFHRDSSRPAARALRIVVAVVLTLFLSAVVSQAAFALASRGLEDAATVDGAATSSP